jgi:hypothetical protein
MRPTCQKLQEDAAAGSVHRVGYQSPAFDLFTAVDTWWSQ